MLQYHPNRVFYSLGGCGRRDAPWNTSAVKGGGQAVIRYRVDNYNTSRGRAIVLAAATQRQK